MSDADAPSVRIFVRHDRSTFFGVVALALALVTAYTAWSLDAPFFFWLAGPLALLGALLAVRSTGTEVDPANGTIIHYTAIAGRRWERVIKPRRTSLRVESGMVVPASDRRPAWRSGTLTMGGELVVFGKLEDTVALAQEIADATGYRLTFDALAKLEAD